MDLASAKEKLSVVIPITIAIIILLLYLNFRSFIEVFIVMGTLPMALVGGVLLLYILDYDLSVAVSIGFIALAGVSVEIGVVMLVYLNHALNYQKELARKNNKPLTVEAIKEAIISGALLRVRPIMMTVLTIVFGLLTVMIGDGTGSEVMRRIATPMVGGIVSATVLTLIVIPSIFLIIHTIRIKSVKEEA